jgi:UDP-N-acetylmuramate--alanine ligase
VEARKLKIPVVKRAEMLAELMRMKSSIAVAGTHGKTTTTSLIASILDQAGMDPTVINGGVINAYNSNSRLGDGEWIVVEADESDGSFTKLMSTIAVVTNIDFDHKDNFRDFSELTDMFCQFAENVPFYGLEILCLDHPEVEKMANRTTDRRIITYGLSKKADVSCTNVVLSSCGSEFDVVFSPKLTEMYGIQNPVWKKFTLSMFGRHNVQNALAAISAALELGISEENTRLALGSFMGVKRRFTHVANINGVSVIDDYAHHPVEIEAVLNAAKSACSGKIYAVMQAHRYTRLANFLDDFAKALELSDHAFITPIYSAGEAANGVDHFSLLERIEKNSVLKADFVPDVYDLKEKVLQIAHAGDFIIFLGAGDITQWAYKLGDLLELAANEENYCLDSQQ